MLDMIRPRKLWPTTVKYTFVQLPTDKQRVDLIIEYTRGHVDYSWLSVIVDVVPVDSRCPAFKDNH